MVTVVARWKVRDSEASEVGGEVMGVDSKDLCKSCRFQLEDRMRILLPYVVDEGALFAFGIPKMIVSVETPSEWQSNGGMAS
jgi:hypothetical protein